jgi:hypothetical protein
MNRLAGIILAAIGLVTAILSIARVVPGLTGTGVALILLGGLVIGLSFVDKPDTEGTERMSTPSTLGNMFFSPTEVFKNLRRHPRWLVAMLLISVLSATYTNLFMYRLTPERVINFTVDKTLEMPMMNDEARKQVEADRESTIKAAKSPVTVVGQAVSGFVSSVFGYCFLALIFLLFALAMGGKINFWQAFAVAIYASLPFSVIRFVLNTIVLFLKDPTDVHPILGQGSLIQDNLSFLVVPSANPVIYSLLASLSLLGFYWLWLNATGLKNGGEKVTGIIGWSAAIAIYAVMILFGVALAILFPGFIS